MATTGTIFPSSGASAAIGTHSANDWTGQTNIYADDASTANITAASYDAGDSSYVLKAYGFDFSGVPTGATIDGVIVRFNTWYRTGQGASSINLLKLLDTSNAPTGNNQCATPVALTTDDTTVVTKGSSTDTWGCALTADWVKNSNFGVGIGYIATANNSDIDVDYVTIEVYYTASATPVSRTISSTVAISFSGRRISEYIRRSSFNISILNSVARIKTLLRSLVTNLGRGAAANTITDDFNRATLGSNWTTIKNALAIYSSTQITSNVNDECGAIRNDLTPTDDQFAELEFVVSGGVGSARIGPAVRGSGTAPNGSYYTAYWGETTSIIDVGRVNGGTWTTIQAGITWSPVAGGKLRLTVETIDANTVRLRLLYNGGEIWTYDDTSANRLLSGKVGIGGYGLQTVSRGDNFLGGDLYGGAGGGLAVAQARGAIARTISFLKNQVFSVKRIGQFSRRVMESLIKTPVVSKTGAVIRAISSVLTKQFSVGRLAEYIRSAGKSIAGAFSLIQLKSGITIRYVVTEIVPSISLVRVAQFFKRVSTSIGIGSVLQRVGLTILTLTSWVGRSGILLPETKVLKFEVNRQAEYIRRLVSYLAPTFLVRRIAEFIRRVSSSRAVKYVIDRSSRVARTVSTLIVPVFSLNRLAEYTRKITVVTRKFFALARLAEYGRRITTSLRALPIVSRASLTIRSLVTAIVPVFSLKRVIEYVRSSVTQLGLLVSLNRLAGSARYVSTALAPVFAAARSKLAIRSLVTSLVNSFSLQRVVAYVRNLITSLRLRISPDWVSSAERKWFKWKTTGVEQDVFKDSSKEQDVFRSKETEQDRYKT